MNTHTIFSKEFIERLNDFLATSPTSEQEKEFINQAVLDCDGKLTKQQIYSKVYSEKAKLNKPKVNSSRELPSNFVYSFEKEGDSMVFNFDYSLVKSFHLVGEGRNRKLKVTL